MARKAQSETERIADVRVQVLEAALVHVPFDGWSDAVVELSAREANIDWKLAALAFPRGGIDLALAFHRQGDARLAEALAAKDMSGMRFRTKIAEAMKLRLDLVADHREAVRRGVTLFALPQNTAEGIRAIWHTADTIWNGLGDSSRDASWYSKRATLSAVWTATVLFWLGDDSSGSERTHDFIDRQIANVMKFEELKAKFRSNGLVKLLLGPARFVERIRAPGQDIPSDLPGKVL